MVKLIKEAISEFGSYLLMLYYALPKIGSIKKEEIFKQMEFFSLSSLFIVALAAAFTGMVATIQSAYQIRGLLPMELLGVGVGKMVMIELGPVLTALVLAGKAGAAISSELATMKVTEQLDAMEVMGIDPYTFLVLPRVVAGTFVTPLLIVFADFVSIVSSAVVAKVAIGLDFSVFIRSFLDFFFLKDFLGGVVKGIVFGFIISSVSSYMGMNSEEGARGVGIATMRAVIFSSIFVLFFDYVLGSIIYG